MSRTHLHSTCARILGSPPPAGSSVRSHRVIGSTAMAHLSASWMRALPSKQSAECNKVGAALITSAQGVFLDVRQCDIEVRSYYALPNGRSTYMLLPITSFRGFHTHAMAIIESSEYTFGPSYTQRGKTTTAACAANSSTS